MRSRILFGLALASVFALPVVAYAAIPFFGPIIPQTGNQATCPASWGMVITVINNIISFLITLAIVFVAPLMIAWSGFLYVVNPVDPSGIAKAKKILTSTIFGIVIALAGWMIVDAIMAVLYHPTGSVGSTWSGLITSGGINPCISVSAVLQQAAAPPAGVAVAPAPVAGDEQAIRQQLMQAGVTINHDPCPAGSNGQGCTNVGGMQSATVSQIINIANACGSGCGVVVTGGTEPGHASGTYSHANGYKVDLSLGSAALNARLQRLPLTGQRGGDSGGPIRKDTCGNQYVQETDHWDITVTSVCVLSIR